MLAQIYAPVRDELDAVEQAIARELDGCDPMLGQILSHALTATGKRLRPALVLLCGRACGPLGPRHVQAAVVVELLHCATLVHDDVIDEAHQRRRAATVNARWGRDAAILLGDLLFARALELLGPLATPRRLRIVTMAGREMVEGELLQLLASRAADLDEARYIEIISKKTGALCGAACALGASLADGAEGLIEPCAAFGRNLGIAFQIGDDCLDIRGDEQAAGKTLGTDLLSGKLTLPVLHARRRGPSQVRRQLDEVLAQPAANGGRQALATLLEHCGAFAYAERTARSYIERAVAHLAGMDGQPARDSLLALADYVVQRQC